MKKAGIITLTGIVALAVAGSALAQVEGKKAQKRGRGFERGGERFREGQADISYGEALINRIINHPEIAKEIGLTEEQIKTLRDSTYEMKKQEIRLDAEKRLAAMEQARLLTESTIDEEAVMAAVEKTSKITAELAKLKIKRLLLMKRTFTPEHIEKVKKLMRRYMQERRRKGGEQGHEFKNERGPQGADRRNQRGPEELAEEREEQD